MTSTSRVMALEVGLGQHPRSCQLFLSLGSQGRVRGTAQLATPRVVMPGNNCCVFNVGQNGLHGPGGPWQTEVVGSRSLSSATTEHLVQGMAHNEANDTPVHLGLQGGSCSLADVTPTSQGQ